MGAVQLLGLAASVSLLAGWRLYACVAALGIAMRLGLVALPDQVKALDALGNPWVIGVACLAAVAELLADKVMWVDSLWDGVHTAIRPIGGALLALAIVDPANHVWQVIVFLLGGGAALLTHAAKAGTRAAVNTSPEPVSNALVSTVEDAASLSALWIALTHPAVAIAVAVVVAGLAIVLLIVAWRVLRHLRRTLSALAQGDA